MTVARNDSLSEQATRNSRQQAETHALRLLHGGASFRQVEEETGLSRPVLEQLVRDFPGKRPAVARPRPVDSQLQVSALLANPANIRSDLGDITGLAETIREHGILQPLIVTAQPGGTYVVLDGHRRLAAARHIGLITVPARLHHAVTDEDAIVLMLVTGLQKADLHPLDEARAYNQLLTAGLTQRDIAQYVGKHQAHVSQRLALLNLSEAEQDAVRRKEVTIDAAYRTGRERSPRAFPTPQARPKPKRVPHFTARHPLADHARQACTHDTLLKLGPACGPCWEHVIRQDARGDLTPLSQAPPPVLRALSGKHFIDPIAVELACGGERPMRQLTIAERRQVITRLHAAGLNDQDIARRTSCSPRMPLRIRQELGLPAITEAP